MTVEIKQLVIRARVDAAARPSAPPAATPRVAATPTSPTRQPSELDTEQLERSREAIVAACVREVMRRLARARER